MYEATVSLAYGTGGLRCPQQFWGGVGVAISKSPKKAIAQATRTADHKCGEGASWVPIHVEITLKRDGRIIHHSV